MAAGGGDSRPRVSKKPDPDKLDVESLFRMWENMQRRRKELQGVRLELVSKPDEEFGTLAHYWPSEGYGGANAGIPGSKPPAVRIFLPSLEEGHKMYQEARYPTPRGGKRSGLGKDINKYASTILKHEAAHAIQMDREEKSGQPDEPVTLKEAQRTHRGRYGDLYQGDPEDPYHKRLWQLVNRSLQGNPAFAKIGLPKALQDILYRTRGSQG